MNSNFLLLFLISVSSLTALHDPFSQANQPAIRLKGICSCGAKKICLLESTSNTKCCFENELFENFIVSAINSQTVTLKNEEQCISLSIS